MTPLLTILLSDLGDTSWDDLPEGKRDRLVLPWTGTDADVLGRLVTRARSGGFKRVRIRAEGPLSSISTLEDLVHAGANELELEMPTEVAGVRVRALRESGELAHVALTLQVGDGDCSWSAVDPNPCAADELILERESWGTATALNHRIESLSRAYRRLSIRGLPLCGLPTLEPGKVLANSLQARVPPGQLDLRFERPDRVFFQACQRCGLSLACDGFPQSVLAAGRELETRVFVSDHERGPESLKNVPEDRAHPPTFLSGRVHVHGVLAGARPTGRMVVSRSDMDRQVGWLEGLGLGVRVVAPDETPEDSDAGPGDPSAGRMPHVFFSRSQERADEAAALERAFVSAEQGAKPLGAHVFARAMGRLLGYPDCCIEAFVEAGPAASTSDLLRAALRRSGGFDWRLNCLDPRSPLTLVPHVPCAFDCRPSAALAQKVADSLDGIFPFLGGTARQLLGRPVLFLDADRCVAFTGETEADGQGVAYRSADRLGARPPAATGPAWTGFQGEVMPSLWAGDRVRVEDSHLLVFRRDVEILRREFEVAPVLLNFGR